MLLALRLLVCTGKGRVGISSYGTPRRSRLPLVAWPTPKRIFESEPSFVPEPETGSALSSNSP